MMSPTTKKGPPRRRRASLDRSLTRKHHDLWVFLLVLASTLLQGLAYRIGEAVDVIYRTPNESMDAKRHQMPLFGVPSVSTFDEPVDSFSLSFEDGGRPLPWLNVVDSKGRRLDTLSVTFVYSKSGEGTIHSVTSQTKYSPDEEGVGPFRVQYEWVEEASVDMASGASVMLLTTLIISVLFLLQTCGDKEENRAMENDSTPYGGYNIAPSTTMGAGSVPKWD